MLYRLYYKDGSYVEFEATQEQAIQRYYDDDEAVELVSVVDITERIYT